MLVIVHIGAIYHYLLSKFKFLNTENLWDFQSLKIYEIFVFAQYWVVIHSYFMKV